MRDFSDVIEKLLPQPLSCPLSRLLKTPLVEVPGFQPALTTTEGRRMGHMKRLLALLFASLVVVGLAGRPAAASTFELGTITPGDNTTGFVANFGTGIVSFEDTIKFSLSFISTSLVGAIQDISFGGVDSANFQLDLFNESDPATSLGTFSDLSGTTLAFSYLNLAAGNYFFLARGGTGPSGNIYKYRFVAGTEVPIPAALLLFATALGGLGFFGYRRRKLGA
jgi:hypothetical protein